MTQPPTLNRRRLLQAAALGACSSWGGQAAALSAPAGPVLLTLSGKLRKPNVHAQAAFDMAMLESLSQTTLKAQTPWYSEARSFTGPLLRDVLASCDAHGDLLRLTALNDFRADMPVLDTANHDVIVARLLDGKPMSVREKGPLFIMYPFSAKPELRGALYYSRAVWQLRTIEIL